MTDISCTRARMNLRTLINATSDKAAREYCEDAIALIERLERDLADARAKALDEAAETCAGLGRAAGFANIFGPLVDAYSAAAAAIRQKATSR